LDVCTKVKFLAKLVKTFPVSAGREFAHFKSMWHCGCWARYEGKNRHESRRFACVCLLTKNDEEKMQRNSEKCARDTQTMRPSALALFCSITRYTKGCVKIPIMHVGADLVGAKFSKAF